MASMTLYLAYRSVQYARNSTHNKGKKEAGWGVGVWPKLDWWFRYIVLYTQLKLPCQKTRSAKCKVVKSSDTSASEYKGITTFHSLLAMLGIAIWGLIISLACLVEAISNTGHGPN